jgi:hypothetical protein
VWGYWGQKIRAVVGGMQQRPDSLQQVRVSGAGLLEIAFALPGGQLQGGLEQRYLAFVRMVHRLNDIKFTS